MNYRRSPVIEAVHRTFEEQHSVAAGRFAASFSRHDVSRHADQFARSLLIPVSIGFRPWRQPRAKRFERDDATNDVEAPACCSGGGANLHIGETDDGISNKLEERPIDRVCLCGRLLLIWKLESPANPVR